MNFFQRRKILRKANLLDLVPVRMIGEEPVEKDRVSLLMPRFKNKTAAALFQPRSKDQYIRIRLDVFGSLAWMLINGEYTVGEIAETMKERHPELLRQEVETEERVAMFFAMLYQQRYISFREIMDQVPQE